MTNPDRDELVKFDLFTPDELAVRLDEWANCLDKSQWDLRSDMRCAAIHLRCLATFDGGVKVRELEWQQSHVSPWQDDWHSTGPFTYTIRCADENGWKWSSGYGYGWCSTPDAAKAAAQADYEARIKSALVEVPAVKGEPDPVAWSKVCNPPTVGGAYIVGGYIDDGTLPRHFERDFALFRQTDDGPEWSLSGKRNIPIEYWHDIPEHPEHRDAIVTAPPADAGMREALKLAHSTMESLRVALRDDPAVHDRKWIPHGIALNAAIRKADNALADAALTAPGATTKSDGGTSTEFNLSDLKTSPELLALLERAKNHVMTPEEIHEQRRSFVRGMCPNNRDYKEWCAQIDKLVPPLSPSEPSSTRSEVSVDELADFLDHLDVLRIAGSANDDEAELARALLDQFEIRRK